MKAEIKSVDLNSDIGVLEYKPDIEDYFNLWMTFTIGRLGSPGGDCFMLNVCTPRWIQENTATPHWGRHMMIVNRYSPDRIIEQVKQYVSAQEAPTWAALAERLGRMMHWEYEDYRG